MIADEMPSSPETGRPRADNDNDDDDQWVTTAQAADALGLSTSGFRALARRQGIVVERRGSLPGVQRASFESYLARSKIVPRHELPAPDARRQWLPVTTAAKRLGVSRYLLQQLTQRQHLPEIRPDGRPGIRASDLETLLGHCLIQPRPPGHGCRSPD